MGLNIKVLNLAASYIFKNAKINGLQSFVHAKPKFMNSINPAELKLIPSSNQKTPASSTEAKEYLVKVFGSFFSKLKPGDKVISPQFNGCHGVAVYTNDSFSIVHFPPMMKSISEK